MLNSITELFDGSRSRRAQPVLLPAIILLVRSGK
jgi:hypothetical protein